MLNVKINVWSFSALRCLLEREMEMAAGLRAELEDAKRNSEEKIERLDMKIQTVTKYYIFIIFMFVINVYSCVNFKKLYVIYKRDLK